jgi:hypothetical protein
MSTKLSGVESQMIVMLMIYTKIVLLEFTPLPYLQVIAIRNADVIQNCCVGNPLAIFGERAMYFNLLNFGYLAPRYTITLYNKYVRISKMFDDMGLEYRVQ